MYSFIRCFDTVSTAAAVSGTTSEAAANPWSSLLSFLPLVLVLVAFYFFLIRPQSKQQKELTQMRNNLSVGDMVTTAGGVVGKVRVIKEDTVTIDSAGQKLVIRRWAVSSVDKKAEVEEDDDD